MKDFIPNLIDERDILRCERDALKVKCLDEAILRQELVAALNEENARLAAWVRDLQSGMHLNCVYCGYRAEPATSDVLHDHILTCDKHPAAVLRAEITRLTQERDSAVIIGERAEHRANQLESDAMRYRRVRKDPSMLLHLSNRDFDARVDELLKEGGDEPR
jgi:hypothetical protein